MAMLKQRLPSCTRKFYDCTILFIKDDSVTSSSIEQVGKLLEQVAATLPAL